MALKVREPNVRRLLASISHRQFQKWVIFHKLHNIDSDERIDGAIAQAIVAILRSKGAKDVKLDDFDPYRYRPTPRKEVVARKKAKNKPGLDPAIFAAFGASDPAVAKRK